MKTLTDYINAFRNPPPSTTGKRQRRAFKKSQDFSITDIDEIVMICMPPAWGDLQRNLGGVKATDKANAFNYLSQRLGAYFNSPPISNETQFDAWHNETCINLIACFFGYYRTRNFYNEQKEIIRTKTYSIGFTYGTAQKFLNMTIKYIYCFDFVRCGKYIDYFKYCHMAIDQYTAEWLLTFDPRPVLVKGVKSIRNPNDPSIKNNFSFSIFNNYADYIDAQKRARIECKNDVMWANFGTYLLEKEFAIWDYYKQ